MDLHPTQAALEGWVVIDLSKHVAGPYCTRLLAGLGAEVIKVEMPGKGDFPLVGAGGSVHSPPECTALFHHLNANKKSVTLDLASSLDREKLRQLIRDASALVESFPPGTLRSLGLGYHSLAQDNPALVMVSISSFGQKGPYWDYAATDLVEQAMGGMMYTCGEPGREPLKLGGTQASYLAGLNAAVATLAAVMRAEITKKGQWIDVSVVESVVSALEATTVAAARDGTTRMRQGNRHGRTHPVTILPCKDGYVGVMLGGDHDWELLSHMVGQDELLNPRFARGEDRFRFADEIDRLLRPFLAERTRNELFNWAQEVRLPFSMVLTPKEILADPQHEARGFFTSAAHPVAGEVLQLGAPFIMEETPWRPGRAPLLGEHTEQVLDRRFGRLEWSSETAAEAGAGPGDLVLDGIRVVDLTSMWAGPLCTRILADLGAEVIKIEAPGRPDGPRADPGYFAWLNRNKLGVTMNLNNLLARECFKRLVALSDVVVENFSPRVMRNFRLDNSVLKEANPDIIMLSMPAYGSGGPYGDYVAYGPGIEASSGLAALTGYRNGPPMLSGSAYGDPVAGLHGAVAVLAALRHRRRSGKGQRIELAQREALCQMIGEAFLSAARGIDLPRYGNKHPTMAPHDCYRCRGEDSWVAIAVGSDEEWEGLCRAMGREALVRTERFRSLAARKAHESELDREVETWTRERDSHEVMQALQAVHIAAGPVMDAREVAADPNLAEREFFESVVDCEGITCQVPGLPWRSGVPRLTQGRAPRIGEHNRQVLGGLLGLSEDDIEEIQR